MINATVVRILGDLETDKCGLDKIRKLIAARASLVWLAGAKISNAVRVPKSLCESIATLADPLLARMRVL